MDVLRGMKFMQRKEEAKRREILVAKDRAAAQSGRVGDGDKKRPGQSGARRPIIHVDESASVPDISLGRRRFGNLAPPPPPVVAKDEAEPLVEDENDEVPPPPPPPQQQQKQGGEFGLSGSRYTLPESVRAPKMPTRINRGPEGAQSSSRGEEGRKRRREDNKEGVDAFNPFQHL